MAAAEMAINAERRSRRRIRKRKGCAMKQQEVLNRIRRHEDELRGKGVLSVQLFGSTARDEAGENSDVDLMIQVRRPFGLFQFADVKIYMESFLDIAKVDLVTANGISPSLRETVQREAVRVF